MKIYDRLAGKLGLSPSKVLSREETLRRIPTLEPSGLQRGVEYYCDDGQLDDSRLAVNLAQTIFDLGGAAVINYMPVSGLVKGEDLIAGRDGSGPGIRRARSTPDPRKGRWSARPVCIFTDSIRKMDDAEAEKASCAASQALPLLVLPKSFLPGTSAIMVPHTPGRPRQLLRCLAAIFTWSFGTTDVPSG